MIVQIISLGCNWWGRPGNDPQDPCRFTRSAAYFNSTGVRCGNKIRRHWIIEGVVRFNGVSNFNPSRPLSCLSRNFLCSELTRWARGNRILFQNDVGSKHPDSFLITLSSEENGMIDWRVPHWKSDTVRPIAISQLRQKQQAMFVMNAGDWVRTTCGVWCLTKDSSYSTPILQLL